jgi:hypothetical protein
MLFFVNVVDVVVVVDVVDVVDVVVFLVVLVVDLVDYYLLLKKNPYLLQKITTKQEKKTREVYKLYSPNVKDGHTKNSAKQKALLVKKRLCTTFSRTLEMA